MLSSKEKTIEILDSTYSKEEEKKIYFLSLERRGHIKWYIHSKKTIHSLKVNIRKNNSES